MILACLRPPAKRNSQRALILAVTATYCLVGALTSAAPPAPAEAIRQSGIRRLESRHLTLYTDLRSSPAVDRLPEQFDQAYPQWCAYFGLPADVEPPWHATACLMRDAEKFRAGGLYPAEVPAFTHGYTIDDHFWFNEQPSDYYRRHLLLHEGTHAFLFSHLGSCGPTWYMEGIAELLATHRFEGDRITLGYFPVDRQEVPYWGRIKLIDDARAAGRKLALEALLAATPRDLPDRLGYAWCWSAAAFLDGQPRYAERFRRLPALVKNPEFNAQVRARYGDDWTAVCAEFALFLHDLEFGYDFQRTQLDWKPGSPLAPTGETVKIRADHGWQNTGIALEAGSEYELRAAGRYAVAERPQTWWCEPGGVTLRYYRGRPLGELLALVVPPASEAAKSPPWSEAVPIGLSGKLAPARPGTLFLRINDSSAELADNAGELDVEVRARQ